MKKAIIPATVRAIAIGANIMFTIIFTVLAATSGIAQVATTFKIQVKFVVFLKTIFINTQIAPEIPKNKIDVKTIEPIVMPTKSGPLVPERENIEDNEFKDERVSDVKTVIMFEKICTMKLKTKTTSQVSFLLCATSVTVLIPLFESIPLNN